MAEIYTADFGGISSELHARIGKIASAVCAYIESESDLLAKRGTYADLLYNVQKSNHATEALVSSNEFGTLPIVEEGGKAGTLTMKELRKIIISHHQFLGEFIITDTMIEDSNFAEMERISRNMVRAYYRTRNKFAEAAILGGLAGQYVFAGKTHDAKAIDGVSLFSVNHKYTEDDLIQSNRFSDVRASGVDCDAAYLADALNVLVSKGRMFKDEVGDPTGYLFDTILVPGGNGKLEAKLKTAVGTYQVPGSGNNDINLQYGLWNIVTLPDWTSTKDEFILMSSDANKQLSGNVFFDRVGFNVRGTPVIDTASFKNVGRARMGIGFGSYKHILHFETLAYGESTLTDGGTAGTNSTDVAI